MALNKLTITIINAGGSTGGNKPLSDKPEQTDDKNAKGKNSTLYKVLNWNQTLQGKIKQSVSPTTFFAISQGVALATQTGKQFINYYVGDIGRKSGDSNYQAIVNRRIEQVTDGLSLGQGALGGAASGAIFGPVGAMIGGLFGIAASGISMGFKYADRERTYQHEMFKENNRTSILRSRADFTLTTGRLR